MTINYSESTYIPRADGSLMKRVETQISVNNQTKTKFTFYRLINGAYARFMWFVQ